LLCYVNGLKKINFVFDQNSEKFNDFLTRQKNGPKIQSQRNVRALRK